MGADDGIANGIVPDGLVIDMGTTAVEATHALAKTIEGRGAHYVDAPVSGGEIGAKGGTLTIMAGGSEAAVARAMPYFEVMGASTTRVGDVGAGQIAKAANQVIVGLTIGAVAEALALAKRAGADPAKVREALQGGFAASRILEVHGQRMIDGAFTPGGKARIGKTTHRFGSPAKYRAGRSRPAGRRVELWILPGAGFLQSSNRSPDMNRSPGAR